MRKDIIFHLTDNTNVWENKENSILLYQLEDSNWILSIKSVAYYLESVYDAITELGVQGFMPSFHLPEYMENIPTKNCC